MQVIVQRHIHGYDVIPLKQVAEVRVHIRDFVFLGHALGFGLVQVGHGHNLRSGDFVVGVEVVFTDLTGSDHTDANRICPTFN